MTALRLLSARPPVTHQSRAGDARHAAAVNALRDRRRSVALGNTQDTPTQLKTATLDATYNVIPHRSVDPVAWREAVWTERDSGHDDHTLVARHNRRSSLHRLVLGRPPGESTKERAYALRDLSRVAHPSGRCADCGEVLHGMPAIMRRPDGGHAIGGVITCANVWACPVCAMRIKGSRAETIRNGVALHRQHYGPGSMLMLTLTASHSAGDDLMSYRERFQLAAGRLFTSRWTEKRGSLGYVYGAEVTHGRSGWHYHRHYVLAFKSDVSALDLALIRDELSTRWRELVIKFMGSSYAPNEHGLDLRPLNVVDYVSKLGLELTDVGAVKRAANGNVSPWSLLQDTATGHGGAFEKFAHYVRSMKGAKCVQFATRLLTLWKRLGLSCETEETAADETIGAALVVEVPLSVWRHIRSTGRLYRLLAACDAGELPDFTTQCADWGDGWLLEREAIRDESPYPIIRRESEPAKRARLRAELSFYNMACDALVPVRAKRERASVYEDGSAVLRYNRLREKMASELNSQFCLY